MGTDRTQSRSVYVPYSPHDWAVLQAPFPLREEEWDQMLAVLDAMKLGLITEVEEDVDRARGLLEKDTGPAK